MPTDPSTTNYIPGSPENGECWRPQGWRPRLSLHWLFWVSKMTCLYKCYLIRHPLLVFILSLLRIYRGRRSIRIYNKVMRSALIRLFIFIKVRKIRKRIQIWTGREGIWTSDKEIEAKFCTVMQSEFFFNSLNFGWFWLFWFIQNKLY